MAYIETRTVGGITYDIHDAKLRDDIASIEETSTATATHTEGSYFIYNDILYRATANIAIGDTITSGTNCTAVTVGGELVGKLNSSNVYNGLDKSVSGFALDARQGKALNDKINSASAYGEVGPVAIASIQDALPLNVESLVVDIEPVQDTSGGDPSPTHICPITGWTGANVVRTGKNLISGSFPLAVAANNGKYYLGGIYGTDAGTTLYFPCKAGVTYVRSYSDVSHIGNRSVWAVFDHLPVAGEYTTESQMSGLTFTPSVSGYCCIYLQNSVDDTLINYWMVESGTMASEFVAPKPSDMTAYSVTFPAAAGTVYGGTLDVVNGVLTVTMAEVDLGTLTWSGNQRFTATVTDSLKTVGSGTIPNWKCSSLKVVTPNAVYGNTVDYAVSFYGVYLIQARINSITDATSFKTAVNGVQLVYELATPITYQLTPQQVAMLQGNNTVFADCGNTTVGYWRDDNLSINKAITERAYDRQQGEALADKLDATQSDIAIIIEGNKTTHTGGVAVRGYVIVRNSTISGITDGLYKAIQAIPANTAIDSTYLTAVDGGGLNELNGKLEHFGSQVIKTIVLNGTTDSNGNVYNANILVAKHIVLYVDVGADYACTTFKGGGPTYNYHISSYSNWNVGFGVQVTGGTIYYVDK